MDYKNVVVSSMPLLAVATLLSLLTYAAVQQNYRQSWNDQQIQLVDEASFNLQNGKTFSEALDRPLRRWDLGDNKSLPWIALFDAEGKPVASEVMLDGKTISIPESVFDAAKNSLGKDTDIAGQNRVTWQPREGVRTALVVQYIPSLKQFVVAGKSMHELEILLSRLSEAVFFAWIVAVAAALFAQGFAAWYRKNG